MSNMGIGDLGIGDWGLGDWPNPQYPIPKPQSPIPNPQSPTKIKVFIYIKNYIFKNFKKIKYNKITKYILQNLEILK